MRGRAPAAYLFDASIFIAVERGQLSEAEVLAALGGRNGAVAAVTLSELLVGAYEADTEARRLRRELIVEDVLTDFPVLPFETRAARVYARLAVDVRRAGFTVGPHDLQVAATALVHGYGVLTLNLKDFSRVPGLDVQTAGAHIRR